MSMNTYGLCFDPLDPDLTIEEQSTVGSFVLGREGDAVTSTTIGAIEALDVNIAGGSITVTESDVYAEDTAHTDGDLGTFIMSVREDVLAASTDATGDYSAFKSDALGRLYVTDDQSLSQLTDINTELDGLTTLVTATNTALADVNSELDGQTTLLTSLETLTTAGNASLANIDQCFTDVKNVAGDAIRVEGDFGGSCNIAIVNGQSTATDAAASVVATALADRKSIWIANEGKSSAYIGGAGVTAANGFPLYRKTAIELSAGPAVDIQAVTSAAGKTADLRTLELS